MSRDHRHSLRQDGTARYYEANKTGRARPGRFEVKGDGGIPRIDISSVFNSHVLHGHLFPKCRYLIRGLASFPSARRTPGSLRLTGWPTSSDMIGSARLEAGLMSRTVRTCTNLLRTLDASEPQLLRGLAFVATPEDANTAFSPSYK